MGLSTYERKDIWRWFEETYQAEILYSTPFVPTQFFARREDGSWLYFRSRHGEATLQYLPPGSIHTEGSEAFKLPHNSISFVEVFRDVNEFPDDEELRLQLKILMEDLEIKLQETH